MKSLILLSIPLILLSSCLKDDTDAPNKFIKKQSGEYRIEKWTKTTYLGGEEQSNETLEGIGTLRMNIVNYGFYSEGDYVKEIDADSQLLNNMIATEPCLETFRWNADEHRISFVLGWCGNPTYHTVSVDGYGNNKQTWTLIQTDANAELLLKEVFELKR
ncbi:MAG: hypothetical protein JNM00_07455 [Flavobacteriales bacterium]|nr:hypothetical protein [Flavobacteriales bacterium]